MSDDEPPYRGTTERTANATLLECRVFVGGRNKEESSNGEYTVGVEVMGTEAPEAASEILVDRMIPFEGRKKQGSIMLGSRWIADDNTCSRILDAKATRPGAVSSPGRGSSMPPPAF